MNITELKKNKSQYHVKVTLPVSDIETHINKELATIAKTAKMHGFRTGKVPLGVLRKKYAVSLRNDLARENIDKAIRKIIKDENLNVALDPSVEDFKNDENQDLEFTLKFDLLPEITLPNFKDIKIEGPKLKISDKDINDKIEQLANLSKKFDKETKSKAKKGDQVTIDAVGYVDDKAFAGGKLDAHKLILGSNAFIPGFEDQLIGSKAGDEVSVKVKFPDDYHAKDLAGKPSEFKVKVLEVHKASESKIDDEFAKKFKCENVEDLKKQIAKSLEQNYEESINVFMKMNLFDKLEKMLDFEVPDSILNKELSVLSGQSAQLNEDSDIKNMSEEEKTAYFNKLALRRVRIGLMLAEYVKQKNIQITEQDIRQAIIAQARTYPGQEQRVIEFYQKNRDAIENIKGPVLEEKAVKAIFQNEVVINEKFYNKEDLENLLLNEIRD